MSSLGFFLAGLIAYLAIFAKTRNLFTPAALLCLFWFSAASIADIQSLKDPQLQRPWEMETYAAIFLSGCSVFVVGLLFGERHQPDPLKIDPSPLFRKMVGLLAVLSIFAVALRLYVFGFSIEKLILSFGGADIKDELSEAIPGVHYFELVTPYLCLAAIFELLGANTISILRRRLLKSYVFYTVFVYCILLSASRGTLLIVLCGTAYIYYQSGRLRPAHVGFLGILLVGLMSALSFVRMSSETLTNSFLGTDTFSVIFSPIYTYVAFNFENLNTLVRADLSPSYVFYSLKFLLWPFFKGDYEAGLIKLIDFDTLFFNARTYLYPFYHDLGLLGCVLYPTIIAVTVTKIHNASRQKKSRAMVLMGLQKPIWFTFFGNYFFGELVVVVPLVLLYLLSLLYECSRPRPDMDDVATV